MIVEMSGTICLSSGCQCSEEYDLCPVQDIEVAIYWSSALMRGSITMSNSPIGGASVFSCPPESVDQEMCCAGTFFYK